MPTPQQNPAISALKKDFRIQYRAILLNYYLNSPSQVWTNNHTQEVLELYKKQLISNPMFKDNLDNILSVFAQESIQQYMLAYLTRDIERLNIKKQCIKNTLKANNSPEAVSQVSIEWNTIIKQFITEFQMTSYVITDDMAEKFIKNLTDTITYEKSVSLSDAEAEIVNRFYRKSEIEIVKYILAAKKDDPSGIYDNQNAHKLLKGLISYLHKNTNAREGFELRRIIRYFSDIYLESIKNLFKLSPDQLQAKIQKILDKNAKIKLVIDLMNAHFIEKHKQTGDISSYEDDKMINFYANEIIRDVCFDFSVVKNLQPNDIINIILDQLIDKVDFNIKTSHLGDHEKFTAIINSSEKSEIIAELKSVLYKEYRPLILNILEVVINAKENNLQGDVIPPREIVDDIFVLKYHDEKGKEHYINESSQPKTVLKPLYKEKKVLLTQYQQEERNSLTIKNQFFEKVRALLDAQMPHLLYEEHKANCEFEAWYENNIMPLVLEYGAQLIQPLFPDVTDESQLPSDYEDRVGEFLVSAIDSAVFLHDQTVKAARVAQPGTTETPEAAASKKQRP